MAYRLRIMGDLGFEFWMDVPNFEGYYQDSTYGRVKSILRKTECPQCGGCRTVPERILKPRKDKYGYLYLDLNKNGKAKTFKVHRIIADTFIANFNNENQINHLNEVKTDNQVWNIRYCSASENINWGTRNERIQKKIIQYDMDGKFIKEWDSGTIASRELGLYNSNLVECLKGRRKTAGGFKWAYKKESD